MLVRLENAVASSWDVEVEVFASFVSNMLSVNDGLLGSRLHEVVLGEVGYLSKYNMEM